MSNQFENKKICVVGLGKTGLSVIAFLQNHNAQLFALDTRVNLPITLPANIKLCTGKLNQQWLQDADMIVLSPGLSLQTPAIQNAIQAGIEVIGDIEIFTRFANKPILAITGANGKSTVTTLVAEMGKAAGLKVGMGGNIGIPALSLLEQDCDLYVLELSSFQLETTHSLKAQGAVVLNISEDHLDRYSSLEAYRQAKLKIYTNANYGIVNGDDHQTFWDKTMPHAPHYEKIFSISSSSDYWIKTEGKQRYLMAADEKILHCTDMGIKGRHNEMNALAAIALADSVNIPREAIRQALCKFTGLNHRFQYVHCAQGVNWINDSKATNVGSTIAALTSLPAVAGRLHLLLGGDGKGADFSELKPYLNQAHIYCYCFGRDGKTLATLSPQSQVVPTMQDAIYLIKPQLRAGDIVLLSPACASLDQFRSFEERGDIFTTLAKQ